MTKATMTETKQEALKGRAMYAAEERATEIRAVYLGYLFAATKRGEAVVSVETRIAQGGAWLNREPTR